MPITITPAPPQARVGPGIVLQFQTDFIGPLPTGSEWLIHVTTGDEPQDPYAWYAIYAYSIPSYEVILGAGQKTTSTVPLEVPAPGQSVQIIVQLLDDRGIVVDSGMRSGAMWDATSGLATLQLLTEQSGTGGFTAEDRQQLALSVTNTQVTVPQIGVPGGSVLTSIGELVTHLPGNLLNRHGSMLVSGQGSIGRGSEPYRVDSQGIEWHWSSIPPGFGHTLGSVDEYGRRIVQWRFIDQDSSGQIFQGGYVDANTEGERFMWGIHNPITLEWYVAPGCVVELSFLVPLLG